MSDTTGERAPAPRQYRSLEELEGAPELLAWAQREFPEGASELETDGVSRRAFLQVMGASLALAGLSTSACHLIRKPAERILPFSKRPEDLVPGRPVGYATSAVVGGTVLGLVVESQDGRPTKIEGNPDHPGSLGATSAWAQAEVLTLYDPDRSRGPLRGGGAASMEQVEDMLREHFTGLAATGGAGLALLLPWLPSPTFHRLVGELRAKYPQVALYLHDPQRSQAAREGAALLGRPRAQAVHDLRQARVILSLDCDLVGVEPDAVRHARDLADARRVASPTDEMARLYVVEPSFSITGATADHRLRAPSTRVRDVAEALAARVLSRGQALPGGGENLPWSLKRSGLEPHEQAFLTAAADDLLANTGRAVVVAGHRQPAAVHALAHAMNVALGSEGSAVTWRPDPFDQGEGTLVDLAEALRAGSVSTLVTFGGNPVYDAPGDLEMAALIEKVPMSIHHGLFVDETAARCTWHVPAAHFLESWGDFQSAAGTASLQQPLIEPLFGGLSAIELLARLVGRAPTGGHDAVRETWNGRVPDGSDPVRTWQQWLSAGLAPSAPEEPAPPATAWQGLASFPTSEGEGLEVDFVLSPSVLDGRYANNAWMQELPDPMTKLTWDNAALLSPATARDLEVESGDVIEVTVNGKSVEIPAIAAPGVADRIVVLPLGYGRTAAGVVGNDVGVNVSALRTSASPWFAWGGAVRKTGRRQKLATTQHHHTLQEPITGKVRTAILREATLEQYRQDPALFAGLDVLPEEDIKSLWQEPNETRGQQWGMSIDLNACVGCNACTIACQAENSIPVVGKERVLDGREMHWIRIDRYYSGEPDDADAAFQPMPCMQCENAPCESVCPVAATAHSPDGLNDMAYNRCIGTRYCSNNCPYKVRRFNFFNFTKENDGVFPLLEMQRNPDVTVRFRGVMEKCTYCVQRISSAKIESKVRGNGVVPDGRIKTACEQVCPTQAIVFGDISGAETQVSRLKSQPRDYSLLAELNTQPRTTYLGRLRNPNPALAPAKPAPAAHGQEGGAPAGAHAGEEH